MLREMVMALGVLTAECTLVLWLEDLQWADYSTLDWLAAVAQHRGPARLMVIGTYRPAEVSLSEHPLKGVKQELSAHGQCEEVVVEFLTPQDVGQYLGLRYPQHQFPPALGPAIHRSTDGNPLFMVNLVDYLVAQGVIVEVEGQWRLQRAVEVVTLGVPESLRQLIEKHLERLSQEQQQLLEVASVVGNEFLATAVAAGLGATVEQVEEGCEGLVRHGQFLKAQGPSVLPDGTVAGGYSFLHALYQTVLYERLGAVRRTRLHRQVGEREEEVYGSRAGEIAAELAVHFERGQDFPRAVKYLQQAAENVLQRYAYREAISYLTKGLELLKTLPDTPERTQQELRLQIALGTPLIVTQGYAAPEVEKTYSRALELCRQVGETPQLFHVLMGLIAFHLIRAEHKTAWELGEQLLHLAQSTQRHPFFLWAYCALGEILSSFGEFVSARAQLEQGIALYDSQKGGRSSAFRSGQNPGVLYLSIVSNVLWTLGYPEQALKRSHEALALARELSHPFNLARALLEAAVLHQYRHEGQTAQERAEELVAFSSEQGIALLPAQGIILQGWALAEQGQGEEGIAQMHQGLAAWRAIGAELRRPYFLALLAEAYGKVGKVAEGLTLLAEALAAVDKNEERFYEAELYRLKGELTLQSRVQSLGSRVRKVESQEFRI
jgi:predicted ATPase